MARQFQEQFLRAQPVSAGLAIGMLCRVPSEFNELSVSSSVTSINANNWKRLVERAKKQIEQQLQQHSLKSSEASIFETHLQLLQDSSLIGQIQFQLEQGLTLDQALERTLESWQEQFRKLKSVLFRDRLLDLQDVILRLARAANKKADKINWPQEVCLYSKLALPSCVMQVPPGRLQALLCSEVSMASHLAMLARSRRLPCLSKVQLPEHLEQAPVIVDGYEGWLILHPSSSTIKRYREKMDVAYWQETQSWQSLAVSTVSTTNFQKHKDTRLWANIDSWRDVEMLEGKDYEGIGLVRTEYLAYEKGQLPNLRSQLEFYKRVIRSQKGKEVVFRLFDFGSDKPLMRQMKSPEANPALGCRGVRFLLREVLVLKEQLTALVQASLEGPISILVPMVCTPSQMQIVRQHMIEICQKLQVKNSPRLGMMIEVPAAALMLEQFAPFADFYSLGTNDLLQYVHAVDRGNQTLGELYNPMSPALLHLIEHAARLAKLQAKSITVCGEMASDPACVHVLRRMGIYDFSMHPNYLQRISGFLAHSECF